MDGHPPPPDSPPAPDTLLQALEATHFDAPAMLVYVDLRDLRRINREAGADEGDRVLREVARQLGQWATADGVAGRVWSNEFVAAKAIDHPQAAADEARLLRDRLCALGYRSATGGESVAISMGVATRRAGGDWRQPWTHAQHACERAKQRGLNQIVCHVTGAPADETPAYSPQAVAEFRQLAEAGRLCLHAQPIMDLQAARPRIAKAEFLVRMEREGVEMPLPAGMIQALERHGAAVELDRFSSRWLLNWIDDHRDALARVHGLSMNLSGASLSDGRFVDELYADIKSAHLPPGKLCLEITETTAIRHLDVAADIIAAFRAIGCTFSLDDFGSGLCSFGYLNTLPIDEVKIDGSFVRDIAHSPVAREIVRAIHHVAQVTGKRTVAEFVDDPRKLDVLKQIGVDYAQGWLFYPAVPAGKLIDLLARDAR